MIVRARASSAARRPRREGAAALEFAFVATPFFFLIFAVLELALVFVTDSMLENATQNASRLIRTGQVEQGGITAGGFRAALCGEMGPLAADCENRTNIDVRVIAQFRNVAPPDPLALGDLDEDVLTYLPGGPGDLVLVRVWYSRPLATPFLSNALARQNSGEAVLSVATAFRNEPFDD